MSQNTMLMLIDLARTARDKAGQLLASEHQNRQQLSEQLAMLERYRNEYRLQLQSSMERGIDLGTLQNYQHFLGSLDKALGQARASLSSQEQKVGRCRYSLQQEQRKLSAYDLLQDRRKAQVRHEERRKEATSNDELNNNTYIRRRLASASREL